MLFSREPIPDLRDYQEEALDALRRLIGKGSRRVILSAPTGAGKTIMALHLMLAARAKGNRVAFVAERLTLVDQCSAVLSRFGIHHGVIQGQNTRHPSAPIIVCSSQTMERRGMPEDVRLVVIDEAHIKRKAMIDCLVARDDVVTVGLTATPMASGLGRVYDGIVTARTTNTLIESGWLVPVRVFAPIVQADMDSVGRGKAPGGEWTDKQAASGVRPIVGDIIAEWTRITADQFGGPVPTLVFTPTVAVGEELLSQFEATGSRFEQVSYLDGAGPERQAKIEEFRRGEITGLISVDALARGFDVPGVRLMISARPYSRSVAGFIQQVGRGMRPAEGKADCVLLDHVGNWDRLGASVRSFWKHGVTTLSTKKEEKQSKKKEKKDRTCPECQRVFVGAQCPECGWVAPPQRYESAPGRLEEVTDDRPDYGPDVWGQICRLASEKYAHHPRTAVDPELPVRWSKAQYRTIMGSWPPWDVEFAPSFWRPHPELVAEISRRVAAWKRNQNRKSA